MCREVSRPGFLQLRLGLCTLSKLGPHPWALLPHLLSSPLTSLLPMSLPGLGHYWALLRQPRAQPQQSVYPGVCTQGCSAQFCVARCLDQAAGSVAGLDPRWEQWRQHVEMHGRDCTGLGWRGGAVAGRLCPVGVHQPAHRQCAGPQALPTPLRQLLGKFGHCVHPGSGKEGPGSPLGSWGRKELYLGSVKTEQ